MSSDHPSFDQLPLQKDGPRGNAWGLFGKNDELGMLNLLTPETTIAATKEIVHGTRICIDWAMDKPDPPCFSRKKFEHEIIHKKPRTVNDDVISLNTQSSSQWDGFRHFGYQDYKLYFNGCTQEEIHNSKRNGTHVWVENGGIVGRGVLLDFASWADTQGRKYSPLTTELITTSDLEKVAAAQGVTLKPADILFIRSGFISTLSALSAEDAKAFASTVPPPAVGMQPSEATLRWIWDHKFAAVAGDMPAFEALPFQSTDFWIHEWLLAGWGMPIGEFFDLDKLAEECKKNNKWSFFFSSTPLHVPGGVASTPNGIAIL